MTRHLPNPKIPIKGLPIRALQNHPLQVAIRLKIERVSLMHDMEYYKKIFDRYGGMMRTSQLMEAPVKGILRLVLCC